MGIVWVRLEYVMNKYPLIKKWLGLICHEYPEGFFVKAEALEAKLAEGFEVYEPDEVKIWGSNGPVEGPEFVALAIGKQSIKKQTQSEAAIAFLQQLVKEELEKSGLKDSKAYKEAKEILEMKE